MAGLRIECTGNQIEEIYFRLGHVFHAMVISGRAPIWLYSYLTHHYHPTPWIATADPRLGYVIVSSHNPDRKVGEIIDPDAPIII